MSKHRGTAAQIASKVTLDDIPSPDFDDIASDASADALVSFGLTVPMNADIFHMADAAARDWAARHAAKLVTNVSDGTRYFIARTIEQALEQGWTPAQLKAELRDGYTFSNARALNIARTELAEAHNQAGLIAAQQVDSVQTKEVLLGEGACEEICVPNADQGPIPIDDEFDSGDDAPPFHPS